jgi:hypothetical protein
MRTRSVEMFLATVMAAQGAIFAIPGETLALPHYGDLRAWVTVFPGSEALFGWLIFTVGAARLIALFINGYVRSTPVIRIVGCVIGSLYWMSLTVSFLDADVPSVPAALAWTAAATGFEWLSAYRSATDAHLYDSFGQRRRAREAKRNGNGHRRSAA